MKTMRMKNILTISGLILSLMICSSCSDSFLAFEPDDSISLEEFVGTPEAAQELLNGAYQSLSSGDFMGGNTWFLAELMADNLNGNLIENGDWLAHYTWTTDIFLGTTRNFMNVGGLVHGRGNYLLDNMDLVQGLSDADKTRMTAEVQFLRGISHFELVRMFAQPFGFTPDNSHLGIPIRTTFSTDPVNRSTVKEVYDQIIGDFTAAINVLPTENGGYGTSWAAKAYLAKVYFQMNDYQNAYDLANDVIENGGFSFDPDLMNRFSQDGTSEAVFELISTGVTNNSGGATSGIYRLDPNTNTAQAYLSSAIFDFATADPADLRGQLWYNMLETGSIASSKFVFDTQSWMNVPLVHLTELKLIRAECAAELGSPLDQAVQDLNDIRERAELVPFPGGASVQAIIDQVRVERRLELVSEGNRLHDLKRIATATENGLTSLPVPNLKIRGADWDCAGMVCQLPDSELSGNSEMEPNPIGGCN